MKVTDPRYMKQMMEVFGTNDLGRAEAMLSKGRKLLEEITSLYEKGGEPMGSLIHKGQVKFYCSHCGRDITEKIDAIVAEELRRAPSLNGRAGLEQIVRHIASGGTEQTAGRGVTREEVELMEDLGILFVNCAFGRLLCNDCLDSFQEKQPAKAKLTVITGGKAEKKGLPPK